MSDVTKQEGVARRILIVGDPALSRSLMRMVLGRLDYVVTCVATAGEASTALAHTSFGLVLVALQLPEMSGLAFARQLRENDATPILLFGDAWDQDAVLSDCQAAGLEGYLPKPISIAKLVSTVRELTRQAHDLASEEVVVENASPPVAPAHLASFTDGDPQLERELGSIYIATASAYLAEMQAALDSGAGWERIAHSLKGASANIGAREVASIAAETEAERPSAETLERLRAAFDQVRRFFQRRATGATPPSPVAA
jgi:CheY-like chemotaxis protein